MKMNEEQFFDAVDTALDFEDENDDDLVRCCVYVVYIVVVANVWKSGICKS